MELDILAGRQFALIPPKFAPKSAPIVRRPAGVRIPLGIFTRIMKVPIFGLSWYIPNHWRRTMSSSGSFSYGVSTSRFHWLVNSVGKQIVLQALDRVALEDQFPRWRFPFWHGYCNTPDRQAITETLNGNLEDHFSQLIT